MLFAVGLFRLSHEDSFKANMIFTATAISIASSAADREDLIVKDHETSGGECRTDLGYKFTNTSGTYEHDTFKQIGSSLAN